MRSYKITKRTGERKQIYLDGGIKTPFKKPVFPHVVFFKVNKPQKYKSKQLIVKS